MFLSSQLFSSKVRIEAALVTLVVAGGLSSCVTSKPASRTPGPSALVLADVVPARFGLERCGAGSLAGVLGVYDSAYAAAAVIEQIDRALPKARNGGVLTLDLLLEARARGFGASLTTGSPEAIASALETGTPPILVLQVLNMPGSRKDFFHYVIADGRDRDRGLVRLHFGDGKARWVSDGWLKRPWRGTANAMILIAPRTARPAPSGREIRYAVALELDGDPDSAAAIYRRLLSEEPDSEILWTNLGNAEVALGDAAAAETAFRRAIEIDPTYQEPLNNLAWLLIGQERAASEAVLLARRAVEADGPDPHLVLDTLARALRRRGDCAEALSTFERALGLAPVASPEAESIQAELLRSRQACE